MEVVFDCSAIIACLAPDESPPETWRAMLAESTIVAPPILPTELANALLMAQKRKRLTAQDVARAITALKSLAVECESAHVGLSADAVRSLALAYDLTAYDAAYLEMAARRGLPLATLDDDLKRAARKLKVVLA